MGGKKRHASWMDIFHNYPLPPGVTEKQARKNTFILDDALHQYWDLGRNLIQLWAPDGKGMLLLVIPHYRLEEFATREHLIEEILTGPKLSTLENLEKAAQIFNTELQRVKLPFKPCEVLSCDLVSAIVRRFSISLAKNRAEALLDIVGFSLLSPLEQVTQLNSLSYSINSAYAKLIDRSINIQFARASTGDGFYIWNKARDERANIDLFDLLQLILADNLIAQGKATGKTVPILKSCFHIGPHYEYYQAIGYNPSTFSYVVGDLSIELARMIERCQPNQILIGDFEVPAPYSKTRNEETVDTLSFIREVQRSEIQLRNVALSGEMIEAVNCRLTSAPGDEGQAIRKYRITDKHKLTRDVYNVNVDIALTNASTLSLGLSPSVLAVFEDQNAVQSI